MDRHFVENQVFQGNDYTAIDLEKGDYESCAFVACNFSNANLTDIRFIDCTFTNCNLSMAILAKTAFREVVFKDSKLLGLHFDHCNPIGLSIKVENCNLAHASFYQVKLKMAVVKQTDLQEVDFTESDLTGSVFDQCNFRGAVFDNTRLEGADFRTSVNYSIDPNSNRIGRAKFSLSGVVGLLDKYGIVIEH